MLSYGANAYSRIITGMPIMDGTGGFKAWKAKVLSDIDLDSVKSQGYSFQIEMNFRAWVKSYIIKEIPIIFPIGLSANQKCLKLLFMKQFLWFGD